MPRPVPRPTRPAAGRPAPRPTAPTGPARPRRRTRRRPPPDFDPAVPSDGLTVDTDEGPVDLVAVERAEVGIKTPLTERERRAVLDRLALRLAEPDSLGRALLVLAAAGLDRRPGSVDRALARRRSVGVDSACLDLLTEAGRRA